MTSRGMWMDVYVELDEKIEKIEVHFAYNPQYVTKVKSVSGRKFVSNGSSKHWTVPMDLLTARRLRELFGKEMKLGPALRAWAKDQVQLERNLRSMRSATDAELKHTPIKIE